MRKIAIVIGHNALAQGAVRVAAPMETEYQWNTRLAALIADMSSHVRVFRRTPGDGEIARVYAQTDEWGADVTCELHFNSVATPTATGTETLYSSARGKAVAERVQAAMVATLDLRDRGLLHRPTGRGAASLNAGRAPAVLIEPYFGSNPTDCAVAEARIEALAHAILVGLGGAVQPVPSPPVDRFAALEARLAYVEDQVRLHNLQMASLFGDGR